MLISDRLQNAVKHSQANKIDVIFEYRQDLFTIRIIDNGVGFNMTQKKNKSLGLTNLQQRAKILGAELGIVSNDGMGTTISISLPLSKLNSDVKISN